MIDEIYEKVMNSGIYEQGIQQGMEQGIEEGLQQGLQQGRFNMALKIKRTIGIKKAIQLSGFSREELENEKLNKTPNIK